MYIHVYARPSYCIMCYMLHSTFAIETKTKHRLQASGSQDIADFYNLSAEVTIVELKAGELAKYAQYTY